MKTIESRNLGGEVTNSFKKTLLSLMTAAGILIAEPSTVMAKEPTVVKTESNIDGSKKALEYIIKSFDEGIFQKRSKILGGNPTSKDACEFNDTWIKSNRAKLSKLWSYIQSIDEHKKILDDFFKINLGIKDSLQKSILTRGQVKKLATNQDEFVAKINKFLSSPTETTKSCGLGFDTVYNFIVTPEIISRVQEAFKSLFTETSRSLLSKIEQGKLDPESSEIIPTLFELVISAANNKKLK